MIISNDYNVCPRSCIMDTLHIQNLFFKETTYTKVHLCINVQDLTELNKPVTSKGITINK